MKMAKTKLPNKPSALIMLALKDLINVEQNKKYEIDMRTWHEPEIIGDKTTKCAVCFAGGVMAMTLKIASKVKMAPNDFDVDTENKLCAIDNLRTGDLQSAFEQLKLSYNNEAFKPYIPEKMDIVEYHINPKIFKKEMKHMAMKLKAIGH